MVLWNVPMPNAESLPAGLPLIAYAEQLCKAARVLVLSDSALTLAEAALARGARLVHVFERDAARRAEAEIRSPSRSITFSAPDEGLREGFFDLIVLENLANEPDPDASLRLLGRLMAPRGVALIGAPNPEAGERLLTASSEQNLLDYYALYDAVTRALPHVRMLGQVPFVGYALIDFAAEREPEPVFDASLVPARGEEPDYFVAFASRYPRTLDEYLVVQLPSSGLSRTQAPPTTTPTGALVPVGAPAPAARPEPTPAQAAPKEEATAALRKQLAQQETWILELEARAAIADERADASESELDLLRETLGNREQLTTAELTSLRQERDASRGEIDRLHARANDLSDLLELKQAELATLSADDSIETEIPRLESQLKEQGQQLRRLEAELREAERTGRALIRKLAVLAEPEPPIRTEPEPSPKQTAGHLVDRLVHAEAELVSLRWTLSMLTGERPVQSIPPSVSG